jgi:CSLREA domain-containing protein
MNKKLLLHCVALTLLVFAFAHFAQAAIFNIPNNDVAALKNAIITANGNGQADTINLATAGTYTLTAVDNSGNGANGLPVIVNNVAGLDLTINGNGATIQRSTAPGTPEFRILQVNGASVDCLGLTIANGKVSGNSSFPSYAGAGIYSLQSTLNLTNCAVRENNGVLGGGIFNNVGALALNGCTVNANVASSGAGLGNFEGTLTLRNSTVSGNTADVSGGGLFSQNGNGTLVSNTFSGNTAPNAGGIYIANAMGNTGVLTMRSTILRAGASGDNIVTSNGGFTSLGYNLSDDAAGGDLSSTAGGLLNGPGDQRNMSPNLGPLQNNGGPTLTHALMFPSPAIDWGDDAVVDAPLSLTTDQRGPGFVRRIGNRVDVGAVESGVSLVVNTVNDHDDGSCTSLDCTLREAITAVNSAAGGDIFFAPGLTGIIQLGAPLPNLAANLILKGPGANLVTVRRNSGGNYRIFTISNGTNEGPVVYLSGLTITNGQAPAGAFPISSGGGILNDHSFLSIERCAIIGNSTALTDVSYGGGIFSNEGGLTVYESTIAANISQHGGGIANRITNPGVFPFFILQGNTISGNTANGGDGGGVHNYAANAGQTAGIYLLNCTLSGNSATTSGFFGGAGGALYNRGSNFAEANAVLQDCTLSGNNAPSAGGIYNSNFSATATVALQNTILKTGTIGSNFINADGVITSLGRNLSNDDAAGGAGTGPGGYLNGAGDVRNTDPLLGPLQANGGYTFTHALLNGSPAINTGIDVDENQFDQRSYARLDTNDIGAFEFGGISPPVNIVSAVSRKLHGGTPFDIDLPVNGGLGVECRSGGASNDYQLVVTFENPVAVSGTPQATVDSGAATIGTGGSGNGGAVNVNGRIVTIPLTNVTNAQVIEVKLTSVTDGINFGPIVLPMAILIGDTTGNGSVNASDVGQTKSRSGQAISALNFRSDVTANGSINASDIGAVKSKSGTAIELD